METCYKESSKYMREVVQKYNLKFNENDNFIFLVGDEYFSTSNVNIANELDYASLQACRDNEFKESRSELGYTTVLLLITIAIAIMWGVKFYMEVHKSEREIESV